MRMIISIITQTLPFLCILLYYIVTSLFSFMAFKPGNEFIEYWELSYRLAYGDFYDPEENNTNALRIFFFIVTILLPLVLLNLLIALMGDIYDEV